jgi:hypothetical protein
VYVLAVNKAGVKVGHLLEEAAPLLHLLEKVQQRL